MDNRRLINLFNDYQIELANFVTKYIPEAARNKIAIVYDPDLEDNNTRFKISIGNPLIVTDRCKIYSSFLDLDDENKFKKSIKNMKKELQLFADGLNSYTAAELAEQRLDKYDSIINGYIKEIERQKYKIMELNANTERRRKTYWESIEKCQKAISNYEEKIKKLGDLIDEFRENLNDYIKTHEKQVKFVNKFVNDFNKYADKFLKDDSTVEAKMNKILVRVAQQEIKNDILKNPYTEIEEDINNMIVDISEGLDDISYELSKTNNKIEAKLKKKLNGFYMKEHHKK